MAFISLKYIILISNIYMTSIYCLTIKSNFKFCRELTEATHFDLENNCYYQNDNKSEGIREVPMIFNYTDAFGVDLNNYRSTKLNLTLLTKLNNEINGIATKCKMEKVTYTTYSNLIGSESKDSTYETIVLSPGACRDMIRTRMCRDKIMKCDGKLCKYTAQFDLKYVWLVHRSYVDYNCETEERLLLAKHANDSLFEDILNLSNSKSCKVTDYHCYKIDYVLVWDENVIHKCPFEKLNSISNDEIKTNKNFVFVKTTRTTDNQLGIMSKEDNLFFSLSSIEYKCNSIIVGTNEGIYLTSDKYSNNFKTTNMGFKDLTNLALSDMDFNMFQNSIDHTHLDSSICILFLNQLKFFAITNDDKYISLVDGHSKQVVFYTIKKNIYVANCVDVTEIIVNETSSYCYEHLPIYFNYNNQTLDGFLQEDRIISRFSKQVSCNLIVKIYIILDNTRSIRREGKYNFLEYRNNASFYQHVDIFNLSIYRPNYHHNPQLIQSIDIMEQLHKYNEKNDDSLSGAGSVVDSQQGVNSVHVLKQPLETVGKAAGKVVEFVVDTYHGVKKLVTAAIAIFIILLIIFLLSILCKFYKKRNSRVNNNNNNNKSSCTSAGKATASCRSNRFSSGRMHFNSKKGEVQLLPV